VVVILFYILNQNNYRIENIINFNNNFNHFIKLKDNDFIDQKTINPNDKINSELLKKLKIINKNSQKLKILGNGEIKVKINIEADLISKSAKKKLEKVGGLIQIKKNNIKI